MLKVNVVNVLGQRRFDVHCPKCKYVMQFFSVCPRSCTACGAKIPNAVGMVREIDERQNYHKTGKTIDELRTV
jgi:hypothetical protein